MAKRTITSDEVAAFLEQLACDEPQTQQDTLTQLCPCRSRCYDPDIWGAICHVFDSPTSETKTLDRAFHALETLVEYAEHDEKARELLDGLVAKGLLILPLEKPAALRTNRQGVLIRKRQEQKVKSRDIPRLLQTLTYGDVGAQCSALRTLCPCRNVRYDKEVWLAIFRAYESNDLSGVRHDALHVIATLLDRARTDPRSQDLLRWLAEHGVTCISLESAIPTWRPPNRRDVNGLLIPRWERSRRSKANRRR